MSDTDTQDNQPADATETTVEFQSTHFDEPAVDAPATETPAAPATDKAETEAAPTGDTPADGTETPAPETPPAEADKPETSDVNLKEMSRAERAEYFRNQQAEQRREVGSALDKAYQPQPLDHIREQLKAQYPDMTEGEAYIAAQQEAANQQRQIDDAKSEIVDLNANLRVDVVEARAKYDWMNPDKPETYDKELHDLTASLFEQGVTFDPNTGQIVDVRKTPMEIATLVDKIRNSGNAKAQLKAQKAAEAQMASVAPTTSTAPPPPANESEDDQRAARLAAKFG